MYKTSHYKSILDPLTQRKLVTHLVQQITGILEKFLFFLCSKSMKNSAGCAHIHSEHENSVSRG